MLKHSQNFIRSHELARKLVHSSGVNILPGDLVIEIGTGKGILTEELVNKVGDKGKVIGIELDLLLFKNLLMHLNDHLNFQLLNIDFEDFILPSQKFKVFSNIPFNKTSDILNKLLNNKHFQEGYLIIQKEAALMYGGNQVGAQEETLKSLLAFPFFNFKIVHEFQRSDFEPIPGVDVVMIKISRKEGPSHDDKKVYADYVTTISKDRVGEGSWKRIFSRGELDFLKKNCKLIFNKGLKHQNVQGILDSFFYFLSRIDDKKFKLVNGARKKLEKEQGKLEKIHRTRIE